MNELEERLALQQYYEEILKTIVETQEIVDEFLVKGEKHVQQIESIGQFVDRGCSAEIIQFPKNRKQERT